MLSSSSLLSLKGQWKGPLMAIVAAVCYGFIPTFTLPIRGEVSENPEAMSDLSILFYRFFSASLILGAYMLLRRHSFRITRGEAVTLIYLAFLSDGAALFLLAGYAYLPQAWPPPSTSCIPWPPPSS